MKVKQRSEFAKDPKVRDATIGEFLEFRFSAPVLGLYLTALIFWYFWIKPKVHEVFI